MDLRSLKVQGVSWRRRCRRQPSRQLRKSQALAVAAAAATATRGSSDDSNEGTGEENDVLVLVVGVRRVQLSLLQRLL